MCCRCCCGKSHGGLRGGSEEGGCDCLLTWKILCCIFYLPFIAVWWHCNWKCKVPILICLLLYLCGFLPGIIFGIYYCCAYPAGGDNRVMDNERGQDVQTDKSEKSGKSEKSVQELPPKSGSGSRVKSEVKSDSNGSGTGSQLRLSKLSQLSGKSGQSEEKLEPEPEE